MAWTKLDEDGNVEGLLKPLTPVVNYVARLNGTDQGWQLSDNIVISAGVEFDMEVDFYLSNTSNDRVVLGGGDSFDFVRVWRGQHYQTEIGGQVENLSELPFISPDSLQSIKLSRRSGIITLFDMKAGNSVSKPNDLAFNIGNLGFRFGSSPDYLEGFVLNFKVWINGTLTNSIPLTNKQQGATQLATVGTVNATMINYDESMWEEL